jgi:hypothetical protein
MYVLMKGEENMTKIIRVEKCGECPYLEYDRTWAKYYCRAKNDDTALFHSSEIGTKGQVVHEGCPLDKEESTGRKIRNVPLGVVDKPWKY